MTKKELVRLIREVVKREIKSVVKNELNEALTILENKESDDSLLSNKIKVNTVKQPKKNYTNNSMLNEVLNETSTEGWPEISQQDVRSRFAALQGDTVPTTDINNMPVDKSKLEKDGLGKALTRDYSELVKRFNK